MEKKFFNLAVIGSGPGGYVAAIKAASLGLKVALIEKSHIGGSCLNVGCIPTKSLLSHAEAYSNIREAKKFHIDVGNISFDYGQMVATKNRVVQDIRKSLTQLILSHGVTILYGEAKFLSAKELKIIGRDTLEIAVEKVIIATGSDAIEIPSFPFDCHRVHSSTSILCLSHLPSSLIIVGGGYIGCEFASLFSSFGVKITIVEALSSLLASQGEWIGTEIGKSFQKQGIALVLNTKVETLEKKEKSLLFHLQNGSTLEGEMVLICVGRKPITATLDLEKAGLSTTPRGGIVVNEQMETNIPGIYAIGDVTDHWMLAHLASHQGMIAASNAAGRSEKMYYNAVPAVVFTNPQVATVGKTLQEAEKDGLVASSTTFPLYILGKAQASLDTTGFVQLITEQKTGRILGAHMIGHEASSLIAEMTLAIQNELTLNCIIDTIHAHPTFAEAWREAALLANHTPIHLPPSKKS